MLVLLLTSVQRQAFIADIVNTRTQVRPLLELGVNNRRHRRNHVTTKVFFLSPPTCTRAQIGDNYAHARTAQTRPFLLLRLFGPGKEDSMEYAKNIPVSAKCSQHN